MGIYHMYVQLRTQPTCPGLLGILSNATEAKKKKKRLQMLRRNSTEQRKVYFKEKKWRLRASVAINTFKSKAYFTYCTFKELRTTFQLVSFSNLIRQ